MCQELLNHIILNFEPDMTLTRIFGVFIIFGTVTSGGEILRVSSKGYIILHNIGSRPESMLLFWFTIFAKAIGFEKFKIVTCSAKSTELGNVTF